jgi:hypothetical protein
MVADRGHPWGRFMAKPVLSLQPSETALFHAASRIYAAYISSGHVTEGNEDDMLNRSITEALRMARRVEEAVQSDSELG